MGCFEDQPRCRDITPSNFLATYVDSVANPPALEITNAVFDLTTGQVTANGHPVNIPSALIPAVGNSSGIKVFVVQSLKLTDATLTAESVAAAIAIVAKGDITLAGTIAVLHGPALPVLRYRWQHRGHAANLHRRRVQPGPIQGMPWRRGADLRQRRRQLLRRSMRARL